MTWMDSYYRVHALIIDMMDCNQDLHDFVGDVTYILHTGCGVGPILWAASAWLALADHIDGSHIQPRIDREVYVGACKALGIAVQDAIDRRMATTLNVNKEDNNYDQHIDASTN